MRVRVIFAMTCALSILAGVSTTLAANASTQEQPWYAAQIAAPPKDPKQRAMLEDVLAAMREKNNVKALSLLDSLLAMPDLPVSVTYPAHYNRAIVLTEAGQYDDAIADLTEQLRQTPGDVRMLMTRAEIYALKADQTDAITDLDTVLGASPDNGIVLFQRGSRYMELSNYEAAVRDYSAGLKIFPNSAKARFLRGVAYERLGLHDKAKADINQAAALGDKRAESDFAAIIAAPLQEPASAPMQATTTQPAPARNGTNPPMAANLHQGGPYPPLAYRLDETGTTEVAFTIETDGSVDNPFVVKSSGFPLLDQAALKGVKGWRYEPATQESKPVAVPWKTTIQWSLRSGEAPPPNGTGE